MEVFRHILPDIYPEELNADIVYRASTEIGIVILAAFLYHELLDPVTLQSVISFYARRGAISMAGTPEIA